jgi:EamA domain-containing membrane protein RarD
LETRGEGFINAAGNGFNVIFNRYSNAGYGLGLGIGTGFPMMGMPAAAQASTQSSLQIVMNYVDATMTIAEAVVIFEGIPIAQGRLFAREPVVNRTAYSSGTRNAPDVVPYRSSGK